MAPVPVLGLWLHIEPTVGVTCDKRLSIRHCQYKVLGASYRAGLQGGRRMNVSSYGFSSFNILRGFSLAAISLVI